MKGIEELNNLKKSLTDEKLANLCEYELHKLCKTGGRSFKMSVPVDYQDTDELFRELINRFKIKP